MNYPQFPPILFSTPRDFGFKNASLKCTHFTTKKNCPERCFLCIMVDIMNNYLHFGHQKLTWKHEKKCALWLFSEQKMMQKLKMTGVSKLHKVACFSRVSFGNNFLFKKKTMGMVVEEMCKYQIVFPIKMQKKSNFRYAKC